jgi:hypothetical protein
METVFGILKVAGCRNERADPTESEWGHVVADGFIRALCDLIRLMPDACIATIAYGTGESLPSRGMLKILIRGVSNQMCGGTPILHRNKGATDPEMASEKSKLFVRLKFTQHSGHGSGDGKPFVNFERAVDAHPDQENAEFRIHLRCQPLCYNWLAHGTV